MKEYVLDANAVIRHFEEDTAGGSLKIRSLFEEMVHGNVRIFMSVVNLGEVFYTLLKRKTESETREYIHTLERAVSMVDVDTDLALNAASLKHRYKLGYADSYAATLAIARKATLVSADPAFEKLGKQLKWMRLPPHHS